MAEKKKRLTIPLEIDFPDPMEFLAEAEASIDNVEKTLSAVDQKVRQFDQKAVTIDKKFSVAKILTRRKPPIKTEQPEKKIPESGKTFEEQSNEAYCLECVEGHTMLALTEMRHAIERYRSAGKMSKGVTEKVRVSIREIVGITEDVKNTDDASPEVKEGLDTILDEVRWIRKEYGISGGLTRGIGSIEDLEALRARISAINLKAYELVEKCPTCERVKGYNVREK